VVLQTGDTMEREENGDNKNTGQKGMTLNNQKVTLKTSQS
jgi:hypothetical protein